MNYGDRTRWVNVSQSELARMADYAAEHGPGEGGTAAALAKLGGQEFADQLAGVPIRFVVRHDDPVTWERGPHRDEQRCGCVWCSPTVPDA